MAQDPDESIQEAAETLQHQLYYNGEALDVALDGLRGYKDQSIACVYLISLSSAFLN